jgi:beta-lactam-binding protein with PASTA domain
METGMAARFAALLPRLLALTVIWLLGAATFTLAAEKKAATPTQTVASQAAKPTLLTVPDVRGKAYVFAKGILQDSGLAWRVQGSVQGYAANSVAYQSPRAGARVVDNGAPTVTLRLSKNSAYGERGLPENEAPYPGTRILSLSEWRAEHVQPQETTSTSPTTTATTTTTSTTTETQPAPEPAETREPDFEVRGAPIEPTDELTLPARARMLARSMDAMSKPTNRLVNYWLYQHAWIVTGARFGWHDGAEALRILIKVDQSLVRRFDFGARSEVVARRALAYVEANTK